MDNKKNDDVSVCTDMVVSKKAGLFYFWSTVKMRFVCSFQKYCKRNTYYCGIKLQTYPIVLELRLEIDQ